MMETGFGMGLGPVFWVLIILLLYYLIAKKEKYPNIETSALEILKKRYAKGEITRSEFNEMKKEI